MIDSFMTWLREVTCNHEFVLSRDRGKFYVACIKCGKKSQGIITGSRNYRVCVNADSDSGDVRGIR